MDRDALLGTSGGAVEAAKRLCRRLGVGLIDPFVLHQSAHVSLHLSPLDIVAKVRRAVDSEAHRKAAQELKIVRHLVESAAPVVGPTAKLPAGPYLEDGWAITLWTHVPHIAANENDEKHVNLATEALHRVHCALAHVPGKLPNFWCKIDACRQLLEDDQALTSLRDADRAFLLRTLDRLRTKVVIRSCDMVPIHGDAHLGNVLLTPSGALWTDFEDVCLGPREWDIGWLPDARVAAFASVDRELYVALSYLRSACISIWCWESYHFPEKREAAAYHLAYLKASCPV